MWSLRLVMSECSLSGRGQGHVSNFYIVDLENFATASRRYTGDIHNSFVVVWFMTPIQQWKRLGRVMLVHMFITHCLHLNLQLHNIDLVKTCRTSSFCTVAWQLARFQLTRCIARFLGDSWASGLFLSGCRLDCSLQNINGRPRNVLNFRYRSTAWDSTRKNTTWTYGTWTVELLLLLRWIL